MNARFAIEPWYPSFAAIREVGITTQNIAPAQLNLIGGTGVFLKNAGMDIAQMVRREPASMVFSVTRESASAWGNNSKIPTTPEASPAAPTAPGTPGTPTTPQAEGAPSAHDYAGLVLQRRVTT